jgi:methionine synthase I (cobalamin-dependent)
MPHPFLTRLGQDPVLCDGAMGTLLHSRGVSPGACLECLSLECPDAVLTIHREYLAAGAEIIQTHTFGANRLRLAIHGRTGQAREACGGPAFVAGGIGPLSVAVPADEALAAFREQAEALRDGGVDLFIVETITSLAEMHAALSAIRAASDLPVVVQMTFDLVLQTVDGADPATAARSMVAWGADVVGVNCGFGPAHAVRAIASMRGAAVAPLAAQPSAGLPSMTPDGPRYRLTPAAFADEARPLRDLGVALLGGCCGTTPAHIAALKALLESHAI